MRPIELLKCVSHFDLTRLTMIQEASALGPKRSRSLHMSKTGLPLVLRVRSKVPPSAEA